MYIHIYTRTQAVCKASNVLKDDILDVHIFQQRFLFAHLSNHRFNSGTQNSVLIYRKIPYISLPSRL